MARNGMNKGLKIALIVAGIIDVIFVLMLVYYLYYFLKGPSLPQSWADIHSDEIPMYGYKDYQDYLTNRPPEQAKLDEYFIESILKIDNTRENGSVRVVMRGWWYLYSDDISTAVKRFNEGWLLDPNYYEVYWGFGVVAAEKALQQNSEELMALSVEMFDKAIELYDKNNTDDMLNKISLYCDAVSSNILKAENGDSPEVVKALNLLEQVKAMKFETADSGIYHEKAKCFYYEAQIWFEKKDYSKSWQSIKLARELDPNNTLYKSDGLFVVDLTKEMPEPK